MVREKIAVLVISFMVWLWVYLSDTFPLILAIGFFVVSDMITGIISANKQGIPFTSKKLRSTVGKFISYGLVIVVAHIIEKQFIQDFPALKTMAGFVAYIELKSMNENFEKITGYNVFKTVLEKIKIK